MQCPSCHNECDPQTVYCPQCGARVEPAQSGEPTGNPAPAETKGDDPRERFMKSAAEKQTGAEDDDESELWRGSYSKKAMVGQWILAGALTLAALIIGLFTNVNLGWLLLAALVVWIVLGLWYAYRRLSVHYVLSTQRLIHEAGLLWRTIDRVELIDIDDVTFRQGPVERMFRVGTIHISSSDKTTPQLDLPGIDNVRHVADEIDDARRKERRRRGLHIEAV